MIDTELNKVKILDCTFRDGGHLNDWHFDTAFIRKSYRALSKTGVDYFEIGYKSSRKSFPQKEVGIWRFSPEEKIREVTDGISGPKITVMVDYGKIEKEDIPPFHQTVVDVVRVATYQKDLQEAVTFAEYVGAQGYEIFLNMMGMSRYSETDLDEAIRLLSKSSIPNIAFADSFGSLTPDRVSHITKKLTKMKGKKIGYHAHNNLQMAFANSLAAIQNGAQIIDASIYGMGRGAGNLPLEVLLSYFQEKREDKYNVIPILNLIDKKFIDLNKKMGWGYSLPGLLSGVWDCHPRYSSEILSIKDDRFVMEDIWGIMKMISNNQSILSYSDKYLNQVKELAIFHKEKPLIKFESSTRNLELKNKHKGKNFLVLANGATLKKYKQKIEAFIQKYQPIILGANYLDHLFIPHYHAFINTDRFKKYISTVHESSTLLLADFDQELIQRYTNRDYILLPHQTDERCVINFCQDRIITKEISVSCLLIALSHFMGASKIFVAGMDGYVHLPQGNFLFYEEDTEMSTEKRKEYLFQTHLRNHEFLYHMQDYLMKNNAEELHIMTPTSFKAHYKGIENFLST